MVVGLGLAGSAHNFVLSAALAKDADHYSTDVWQTEEGLPGATVTSIAQTPDGYLWICTFDGLARFDGIRFAVFDAGTPPRMVDSDDPAEVEKLKSEITRGFYGD